MATVAESRKAYVESLRSERDFHTLKAVAIGEEIRRIQDLCDHEEVPDEDACTETEMVYRCVICGRVRKEAM